MSPEANIIERVRQFLRKLEANEFSEEEETAFQELEYAVSNFVEVQQFLQGEYIHSLFEAEKSQKRHLLYLIHAALRFPTRHFGRSLTNALINIYSGSNDPDILQLIVSLIIEYSLVDSISLENEGQNVRFQGEETTFTIRTIAFSLFTRQQILKLMKDKYTSLLVENETPDPQEVQSVIQRFSYTISLLSEVEDSELQRSYPLLPLVTKDARYSPKNSNILFGRDLGVLEYEEQLFREYRLPLFPLISEDKLAFENGILEFRNEGLGCLPSASTRVMVGEDEFELGETQRVVIPGEVKDLYVDNTGAFVSFLRNQSLNLDVKVVFSFRKFCRNYEYSVLSSSVGRWLTQIPQQVLESTLPYEISLANLAPLDFERLCMWIVQEYKTEDGKARFTKIVWLNEQGGGEQGRDVEAIEAGSNRRFVFQCKRVERFTASQVSSELKQFQEYIAESPEIKPDVYVFFLSSAITADTKRQGDLLAAQMKMEIEYWPKSQIDYLVRKYPDVNDRFWRLAPAAINKTGKGGTSSL